MEQDSSEGRAPDVSARVAFEAQARAAGLELPRPKRTRPWLSAALVLVVVGSAVGVGVATGWAIGPRQPAPLGVYGQGACAQAPSYLSVDLTVTVSSFADPSLAGSLSAWATDFSEYSGDCVHIEGSTSDGDGYVPELAGAEVKMVVSDLPPNATDMAQLPAAVALVPVAAAPVAVLVNLAGLPSALHLNGSVLAAILDGAITSWGAAPISALNPGLDLGSAPPISVVYRSGAADATSALSEYLARASATWNSTIGVGPRLDWPVGTGVGTAAQMAAELSSTPGAIGYLESTAAVPANASEVALANPSGDFVLPSSAGASAAAIGRENATALGAANWTAFSLVDAAGAHSYPVCEPVYFGFFHELGTTYADKFSATNATWMLTFVWYLVHGAGAALTAFGYGTLPAEYSTVDAATLVAVTFNGGSLLENNEGAEGGEGGETGEF